MCPNFDFIVYFLFFTLEWFLTKKNANYSLFAFNDDGPEKCPVIAYRLTNLAV